MLFNIVLRYQGYLLELHCHGSLSPHTEAGALDCVLLCMNGGTGRIAVPPAAPHAMKRLQSFTPPSNPPSSFMMARTQYHRAVQPDQQGSHGHEGTRRRHAIRRPPASPCHAASIPRCSAYHEESTCVCGGEYLGLVKGRKRQKERILRIIGCKYTPYDVKAAPTSLGPWMQ